MPELDPCQIAAVEAGPVELFVAAGAGSGKTRVLTSRFVSAVLGASPYEPCDPGDLLAVTFTEKAAGELSERIRAALAAAGEATAARAVADAWISTIHGMCSRILHRHAFDAGIDPHFRVLDQTEASSLEADALEGALREALALQPVAVEALLDAYPFEMVVTAARDARSCVRALGLGVEDIATVPPSKAVARLKQIADELESLVGEFGALRALKTVDGNAAVVRSAAAEIRAALSLGDTASLGLLCTVSTRGLRHSMSIEGLDDLVDAGRLLIDEARSCAAQLRVGVHEIAFLTFVRALEAHYAALKSDAGALDFEDLQVRTALLLESRPDIADEYRARFSMLMLDEFQDTNALQLRIVESLSRGNLCTVGDENQSIYAFRHADIEVFRERAARVVDSRQLDINYRIAPPLLAVINGLFSHPALLGPGFMSLRPPAEPTLRPDWPARRARFEARFIDWSDARGLDTHRAEGECVADRVAEFVASGVAPGSIAVLMRALSGGRAGEVERSLSARGVPAVLASGGAFFDCTEVIEARALLKVIDNVRDDAALVTVLAGRLTGLKPDSLVLVRRRADTLAAERGAPRREAHIWNALLDSQLRLDDDETRAVARTVDAITQARRLRGIRPLRETVLEPLLDLEVDLVLFASGAGGARAWSNLLKLARLASDFEQTGAGDLSSFLSYLELRETHAMSEQEATLDGESDAVRIMSIHAAKGLEFPVVVLAGLAGGRSTPPITVARVDGRPLLGLALNEGGVTIPTLASAAVTAAAGEASAAEAVRLLYVGCTRAQEALTVVARTNPTKDADESLGGLVRRAIGAGGAGTLTDGVYAVGEGSASVRLVIPGAPGETEIADAPPIGAPSRGPCVPGDAADGAAAQNGAEAASRPAPPSDGMVPRRVSYTGLATYGRCPYRFYLTSIARLPAPPAIQGSEALAFGSAVHAVLERCSDPLLDPRSSIATAARAAGLSESAVPRLTRAVAAYRALPVAAEVLASGSVMREAPIAVPIAGTVLAGAIDVIAWDADRALIVDYKTGAGPLTSGEAKDHYRLQAECYALAALRAGASAVRVVFAEIERCRETTYEYASPDGDSIATHIESIIASMDRNEYRPRSEYKRGLCETCPGLGGMCPVRRPSDGGAG